MADANIAQDLSVTEQALPVGTVLCEDQFTITQHLGAGGFGITYRAQDNFLGRTVVVKECFPEDFCYRVGKNVAARNATYDKPMRSIVRMFVREARSLAKLRHPNIVGVHRIFEENDTAYMVLDLIDGRDLFDIIESNRKLLSPTRVKDILLQLLDAIEEVHKIGLLHRDISPDNILIEKTGAPVLIDFGAAKGDSSRHTRAVSSLLVVKDGYSPQEFYVAGSEQAPCSDLYALAATFYHVLSGQAPPNSQTRLVEIAGHKTDPCVPLAGRIPGYDDAFLQAIDSAMQIHPNDRLQSAAKWRALILEAEAASPEKPTSKPKSNGLTLELELSLSQLVEETNDVVRRTSQVPEEPKAAVPKPQPEKLPKPDWIEEFNKESLAPANARKTTEDFQDDDWQSLLAEIPDTEGLSQPAPKTPQRSETNWIGKAAEKQDRILSEAERAYGIHNPDRVSQPVLEPAEVAETLPHKPVPSDTPPATRNQSRYGPFGFVVGLLFCGYFIYAYLNL